MADKDRLTELLKAIGHKHCFSDIGSIADYLIANGVTVNEWRPASEPPKNGEERVAVFLQDDPITAAIGNNRIDTDRYLNGGWVRWGRFVTHWMPLPDSPKEVAMNEEWIEYVYGIPCKVKREKFPDGYHDVYTFKVDGWEECSATGRKSAKRVINGRLDAAVRNTILKPPKEVE